MNPKFSIIIPVYDVAPYLRECLDSVLAQTFTDWEAICVDVGATDGGGAFYLRRNLMDAGVALGVAGDELLEEFGDWNAKRPVHRKPLCAAVKHNRSSLGIVGCESLETGEVFRREFCGVLYLDGVEAVVPVDDKVDLMSSVRSPEAQCVAGATVVDPGAKLLEDKPFERRAVDFGRCVKRTARSDGAKYAGIEEIEFVVADELALRSPRERRKPGRYKQVNEDGKIRVHHRTGNTAVARYVRRRVKGAVGEGYRFKETRECREVSHEPLVLDFFPDVESHVRRQCFAPVVCGDDEWNHTAHKGVFKVEIIAHLGGEKWMAESGHRTPGKQIYAASLKFARTGASEDVLAGISVALNQAMHDGKQSTDALHFVHNHCAGVGRAVHNLCESFRVGLKPRFQVFAQKVDKKSVRVCLMQPCGLSRASRSEKEEISCRASYVSLVSHERYDSIFHGKMQGALANFREKCKWRLRISTGYDCKIPSVTLPLTHV